ncbi:TK/FER protein kinase [Aphelenchoides avenae]|nr:TK/FER protein kinase [Aphelenchus avenae]
MRFGEDEWARLPYCHGHMLDEDVERRLTMNGDFLFQTKCKNFGMGTWLVLAVRKWRQVYRFDVMPCANGYTVMNKAFKSIEAIVEHFTTHNIRLPSGAVLWLHRPIQRNRHQLSSKDIIVQRKIGSGSFGLVSRARLTRQADFTHGRYVAVKRIDDSLSNVDEALETTMKEAKLMQQFHHKNVIKLLGCVVDQPPFYLVMELCELGSLEDMLRANPSQEVVTIDRRIDWCRQASCGLEYLHSLGCIHGDFASRNALLRMHHSRDIVKICDFGMCQQVPAFWVDLSKPLNVRWLAPEVYAFGMFTWELFVIPYSEPFHPMPAHEVKDRVLRGFRVPNLDAMPQQVARLMERCWSQLPEQRPTAEGAHQELERICRLRGIGSDSAQAPVPPHDGHAAASRKRRRFADR